jgi:hypothetical protein
MKHGHIIFAMALLATLPVAAQAQTAPGAPPAALSTLMEDWSAQADAQRHVAQSLSAYIKDQQQEIAGLKAQLAAAQKGKPADKAPAAHR